MDRIKRNKLKKHDLLVNNMNHRSASERELSPPRSKRTSQRPVPSEENRSKNTNRVPSLEDLYKAALERTRPESNQKEVLAMFYVGIDWADDHHDIFIVDESGNKVNSFRIDHNPQGLSFLRDQVRKLTVPKEQVIFAIETHKNLLVDFLLDEGYTVYSINPKSVDRYRDRYRVSGAKDDTFDAMVLANIIRTDRNQHRAIMPNSDLGRELKVLTQDEQRLIRLKTKLINQIQACLKDYYPQALELFCQIDQPVTLDFLLAFSKPQVVPLAKLMRFLKKHHHAQAEEKAKEIYNKLSGQHIFVEELTIRAKSRMLIALVNHLKMLLVQLDEYQKEIERLFAGHPDADIFKSLPGAGQKNAPRLLAEIGDNRQRYPEAKNLQSDAGTSPVTEKSGKVKIVHMRFACRKSFRNTLYQFSFSSLAESLWAKQFYYSQRASNNTHTEALRTLSNKWLKIIFRLWKDHLTYNEDIHLANIMRYQLKATPVVAQNHFSKTS